MTRALQIGVPAASSSMIIALRRSIALVLGVGKGEMLGDVWPTIFDRLSTTSRWQIRHNVSQVRLKMEFFESYEVIGFGMWPTARSPLTIGGAVPFTE